MLGFCYCRLYIANHVVEVTDRHQMGEISMLAGGASTCLYPSCKQPPVPCCSTILRRMLWGLHLSVQEQTQIAAMLGADASRQVCLHCYKNCLLSHPVAILCECVVCYLRTWQCDVGQVMAHHFTAGP